MSPVSEWLVAVAVKRGKGESEVGAMAAKRRRTQTWGARRLAPLEALGKACARRSGRIPVGLYGLQVRSLDFLLELDAILARGTVNSRAEPAQLSLERLLSLLVSPALTCAKTDLPSGCASQHRRFRWQRSKSVTSYCGWNIYSFHANSQNDSCNKGNAAQKDRLLLVSIEVAGQGQTEYLTKDDKHFGRLLSNVLNMRVGLVTANAFISTLGGGHFLCKQIEHAEAMALRQIRVARQLGDLGLEAQCRIHLTYNQVQRGKLSQARAMLRYEWISAHMRGDELVKSMIRSAWLYVKRLSRIQKELKKQAQDKLDDAFYRQRFLK